jgi:hypothetical protein
MLSARLAGFRADGLPPAGAEGTDADGLRKTAGERADEFAMAAI